MDEIRFVLNMFKREKSKNDDSRGEAGSGKINEAEDRNDSDKDNG